MTVNANFHVDAVALIISAARESGLLEEIAQALCYADKNHHNMPDGTVARAFCFACALRDELIDAFDAHTCLASGVLEGFHGEGFCPHEAAEEEVAPYRGISSTPATPNT